MADTPGKDSERLLAEALRARATGAGGGSAPAERKKPEGTVARQPLTLVQLVLASLIGGLVVGILIAVLTLR